MVQVLKLRFSYQSRCTRNQLAKIESPSPKQEQNIIELHHEISPEGQTNTKRYDL